MLFAKRAALGNQWIKNDQGQYAHQACVKARAEKATGPTDVDELAGNDGLMTDMLDDGLGDGLDDGMLDDALLGDLPMDEPADTTGGLQAACPGCGSSLNQGTVICMSCGFDTRSGKARKVKVAKQKAPASGVGGLAASAGSAAASGLGYLLFSTIGACVGGLLGAFLWAVLIIAFNIELGYAAIGVGILCGFGAALGARGNGGMITGVIAALVTLFAISTGKMFAVIHFTDQMIAEYEAENDAYYENLSNSERSDIAIVDFADEYLSDQLESAELDDQTREAYDRALVESYEPSDYPAEVAQIARDRYDAMTPEAKDDYFDVLQSQIEPITEAEKNDLYAEGFAATFGLLDIVFFLIAVVAAFKVGSSSNEE
ncbi:MAG: hypothetical protein AB8F26_11185 [Phycisphaerales bacterium]